MLVEVFEAIFFDETKRRIGLRETIARRLAESWGGVGGGEAGGAEVVGAERGEGDEGNGSAGRIVRCPPVEPGRRAALVGGGQPTLHAFWAAFAGLLLRRLRK